MRDDVVATWYLHDTANQSEYFPQAILKSGTSDALKTYMQCVCVFFASRRAGANDRLLFYSNLRSLPEPYGSTLESLGATKVFLPNETRPPRTAGGGSWSNQFYIFDILGHLSTLDDLSTATVVDSDCVWRRDASDLRQDALHYGALTYNLHEPATIKTNGLSREDMGEIYAQTFGMRPASPIYYCGGEFFGAGGDAVRKLNSVFEEKRDALFHAMAQYGGGEEAHILSLLYHHLGYPCGTGNQHIKRVWTNFRHNNVEPDDGLSARTFLHLPSEKRTGFQALFSELRTYREASDDEKLAMENVAFGLPRRSLAKTARDVVTLARLKVRRPS